MSTENNNNDKGISRRSLLGTATVAGAAGVVGTVSPDISQEIGASAG